MRPPPFAKAAGGWSKDLVPTARKNFFGRTGKTRIFGLPHARTILAILACCLAAAASPLPAQFWSGYVVGGAREALEKAWDDSNAYQVERIYQVARERRQRAVESPRDTIVIVDSIVACKTLSATPYEIHYDCPNPAAPTIHVHTPATCDLDVCTIGGISAYDPNPSRWDLLDLLTRTPRRDYDVIQVDRRVFVFYFRHEYERKPE